VNGVSSDVAAVPAVVSAAAAAVFDCGEEEGDEEADDVAGGAGVVEGAVVGDAGDADDEDDDDASPESAQAAPASPSMAIPLIRKKALRSARGWSFADEVMSYIQHAADVQVPRTP